MSRLLKSIGLLTVVGNASLALAQGQLFYVKVTDPAESGGYVSGGAGGVLVTENVAGCDLFTLRPGSQPVQLTDHKSSKELGGNMYGLEPSPDGRYVAFLCGDKSAKKGEKALFLLDSRTKWIQRLSKLGDEISYAWSNSGDSLAFEILIGKAFYIRLFRPSTGHIATYRLPKDYASWTWRAKDIIVAAQNDKGLSFTDLVTGRVVAKWDKRQLTLITPVVESPSGAAQAVSTDKGIFIGNKFHLKLRSSGLVDPENPTSDATPTNIYGSPNGQHFCCLYLASGEFESASMGKVTYSVVTFDVASAGGGKPVLAWVDAQLSSTHLLGWFDNKSILMSEAHLHMIKLLRYPPVSGALVAEVPGEVIELAWVPSK
jgi:hypothetical protein